MISYYLSLAIRSLRRNKVLTALMIAAIGVGIGASMTTLTLFRAMSADPIPEKSGRLFAPQIDVWERGKPGAGPTDQDNLPSQLTYADAMGLMNTHAAFRQTAMYATDLGLAPSNSRMRPFQVHARAVYGDFFAMFDVPFQYGVPWAASDDTARSRVVVISRELNDKVFAGANSVGQTLRLNNQSYRVVGVLNRWQPLPRFYDLEDKHRFGKSEDLFLPLTRALEAHLDTAGGINCSGNSNLQSGWDGLLRSECVWFQFWVELDTPADAARYSGLLANYAAEQRRAGRFQRLPMTRLRDVRQWLTYMHVVTNEARLLVVVSFSFLLVCLLNAMGLMLAKTMGRARDIGVRRALGASRRIIVVQCLMEAAVVGIAGAAVGLILTLVGLWGLRGLLSERVSALAHLDVMDTVAAVLLAIVAAVIAGLYPTWRAAQVQPAWHLKAQ